ncbi:MAG: ribonuclease III [Desulfobacterota bacterium]|nr:ribonuclease III [Thermodesulfobacteriota bacterium]
MGFSENNIHAQDRNDAALRASYAELQDRLGYHFKNILLLEQALTHKSYANEMNIGDKFGNERLEFLGDAVLELIIRDILLNRFPQLSEGKLSNMRAAVVNEDSLSSMAQTLDIGRYIYLSKGEYESKGHEKKSILANVFEAIIAAVYYDGGFQAAHEFVERHFSVCIEDVAAHGFYRDYKSRLQEYCQKNFNALPRYIILTEEGSDHIKTYVSQVLIDGQPYEKGSGHNKKSAEQDAARNTLRKLLKE